jgi:hypothetical protein
MRLPVYPIWSSSARDRACLLLTRIEERRRQGEKLLKYQCDYKILHIFVSICNNVRLLCGCYLKNKTYQQVVFLLCYSALQEYFQKPLHLYPAKELWQFSAFSCKNFVEWLIVQNFNRWGHSLWAITNTGVIFFSTYSIRVHAENKQYSSMSHYSHKAAAFAAMQFSRGTFLWHYLSYFEK